MAHLSRVVPAAAASVDRVEHVPSRLAFLFDYFARRALGRAEAEAARVRQQTGPRAGLFHPMRLSLTGEPEGLEPDAAVPAITGPFRRGGDPGSAGRGRGRAGG